MAGTEIKAGSLRKMEVTLGDGMGSKITVVIEAPENVVMGYICDKARQKREEMGDDTHVYYLDSHWLD